MTLSEFSNEFDTLLNSYSNNNAGITLDEYEKSVFLTKAQEDLIIGMYNGLNSLGESFESSEEFRRYLTSLVRTYTTSTKDLSYKGLSKNSVFFKLPEDILFITYESVSLQDKELGCMSGEDILVVPITLDEYHKVKRNPFKNANERKVLRLDISDTLIELISKYNIESYLVRYLARPTPIILTTFPSDLTINGSYTETECSLNPILHRTILERAVRLALMSKSSTSTK